MHYGRRLLFLALILCAGTTALAAWLAQQSRPLDTSALGNASQSHEWPTYGGDYGERRFSSLNQINVSNVARLGLAWSHVVGTGGGNQEATPLFWNGVLYSVTNWSIAFAVDARTQRELWRYDPEVDRNITSAAENRGVCCGVINRGIALYEGKVFVPVLDGRLVALDAGSGKPAWSVRVYPAELTGYSLTM